MQPDSAYLHFFQPELDRLAQEHPDQLVTAISELAREPFAIEDLKKYPVEWMGSFWVQHIVWDWKLYGDSRRKAGLREFLPPS